MDALVNHCFQNGETWATGSFTLTGKNPERPIYKTTNINTWPSKLKNWKYYNLKKRGGMWIPADKEFHIDEACELTTHIIWAISPSRCQTLDSMVHRLWNREYGPHNDEFRPT